MPLDQSAARRHQTAIASFTVFAVQSRQISATRARAVDVAAEALSVPMAALIRHTGEHQAVVAHARGRLRWSPKAPFESDAGALTDGPSWRPIALSDADRADAGAPGSTLSVPVPVEGLPWGRLLTRAVAPNAFTPADAEALTMIAAVLGAAIERDLVDRAQEAVAGCGRFALQHDVADTAQHVVAVLHHLLQTRWAALARAHPERTTLQIAEAAGAIRAGEEWSPQAPSGPTASAPVMRDGQLWGRLLVGDLGHRRFTPREEKVVDALARILTSAVDRSDQPQAHRQGPNAPAPASLTEVALLDGQGVIVWVNQAWMDFCRDNGGDPERTGVGVSYLRCIDAARDPVADQVGRAIQDALRGDLPAPQSVIIPCHRPGQARWYDLLVSSRLADGGACLGATVTLSPRMP